MTLRILCLILCYLTSIYSLPAETSLTSQEEKGKEYLRPNNEKQQFNLSDYEEVDEKDIPEGTWVLEVEEPVPDETTGEILQTANNVVFRPLFRYRQRQGIRQANRRTRRRYYMPRRSYRQTAYGYYPRYRYRYPYSYYY